MKMIIKIENFYKAELRNTTQPSTYPFMFALPITSDVKHQIKFNAKVLLKYIQYFILPSDQTM